MQIVKNDRHAQNKDSLLGGAALSLSDLEIVEAQEIKWILLSNLEDAKLIDKLAS